MARRRNETRLCRCALLSRCFQSPRSSSSKAIEYAARTDLKLISTTLVLSEFASGVAHSNRRQAAALFVERFATDPQSILVPLTDDLFRRGVELFGKRSDKYWSLVDCIPFLTMEERGIQEALTGDHHFEQAGFLALLK